MKDHRVHTTGYLQPGGQYDPAFKQQQENQQAVNGKADIEYYVFGSVQKLKQFDSNR